MIAELGLAALWLTAGLAALQLLLSIPTVRGAVDGARTIRAIAVVQGVLTLTAFAALLIACRHEPRQQLFRLAEQVP